MRAEFRPILVALLVVALTVLRGEPAADGAFWPGQPADDPAQGSQPLLIGTVEIGIEPLAVAVNPTTHRAYASGESTVRVLDGSSAAVVGSIDLPSTNAGPMAGRAIAVDPLLGLDLEVWGVPTSQPVVDPNNRSFVYLRFQRGIMHYDAGCNCTLGILLADYLKAVLTGEGLPGDLDQEAQNSPFYRQLDPTALDCVHDSSRLSDTDLTNAFTQE